MSEILIRKGTKGDALAIAEIHAYTWQSAYSGILPDDVIEEKIKGIPAHAEFLSTRKSLDNFRIAEVGGKVAGLLTYSKSRDANFPNSAEIVSIYVLPKFQHIGVGKKLFLSAIGELVELGYSDMILNVLKENKKAIGFYTRFGGSVVGEKTEPFGQRQIPMTELIIKFDNLKKILEDNMER